MSMKYRELSKDILFFCTRLLDELKKKNQKNVFFLAREGQILKNTFDLLAQKEGYEINTHYKLVSRASTFLPSLEPIETETFETLFRQYRSISISDFLNSLGFGDLLDPIKQELKLDAIALELRLEDLPSSELFQRVKSSKCFRQSYTTSRVEQKELIGQYFLNHLSVGEDICVVDVGWKGTIQDHLFKALNAKQDQRRVRGYYLGLLYPSNLSSSNLKSGLLFSRDTLIRSKDFWIFNENRALFELLLSADHGSAFKYQLNKRDLQIEVALQPFVEKIQYFNIVKPIQDDFMFEIKHDLEFSVYQNWDISELAKMHYRLVFEPTNSEVKCFESLFQYENFGVFENTYFLKANGKKAGVFELFKAIVRGDESKFGFWPYVHIREHYNTFLAKLYRLRSRFFI
jgi:hypothetical protein